MKRTVNDYQQDVTVHASKGVSRLYTKAVYGRIKPIHCSLVLCRLSGGMIRPHQQKGKYDALALYEVKFMKKYDVAAYIWPSYTGDEPRTRMFWPEGIGEWQTVHNATQKFPEHQWPRKPVWGYVNEADRYVMEMQINAAADHGVNVFIYDWYWYDHRPFLENCLNDGYLKARNNDRVKFYLMWANHNVTHLWDKRIAHIPDNIIWDAAVDRKEFERLGTRLVEKYFSHPNYYRIDGKPVFMIYNLPDLIRGLGDVQKTADALDWLKDQAVQAGLPGLHLQVKLLKDTKQAILNVDPEAEGTTASLLKKMGFESMTHYQFTGFVDIDRDYLDIVADAEKVWNEIDAAIDMPYFPHVSLGWDNNPRYQTFRPGIVRNNTPENVQIAFEKAKAYADAHPDQPPLIVINSWNEWTETSYLQPDDLYGYGYLEALRKVFLEQNQDG